jgi:hypothetical protein
MLAYGSEISINKETDIKIEAKWLETWMHFARFFGPKSRTSKMKRNCWQTRDFLAYKATPMNAEI